MKYEIKSATEFVKAEINQHMNKFEFTYAVLTTGNFFTNTVVNFYTLQTPEEYSEEEKRKIAFVLSEWATCTLKSDMENPAQRPLNVSPKKKIIFLDRENREEVVLFGLGFSPWKTSKRLWFIIRFYWDTFGLSFRFSKNDECDDPYWMFSFLVGPLSFQFTFPK